MRKRSERDKIKLTDIELSFSVSLHLIKILIAYNLIFLHINSISLYVFFETSRIINSSKIC